MKYCYHCGVGYAIMSMCCPKCCDNMFTTEPNRRTINNGGKYMINIELRTVVAVITTVDNEVKELEQALRAIRGTDWEEDVAKDPRSSVRLLYGELTKLRDYRIRLLNASIQIDEDILANKQETL